MTKIKKYILVSTQRSGSGFIRIWLNRHSNIYCYAEVFLSHYSSPDGFYNYCSNKSSSKLKFSLHYTRLLRKLNVNVVDYHLVNKYLDHLFHDQNFPAPWTDLERANIFIPKNIKSTIGFKVMHNTLSMNKIIYNWIINNKPYIIHLLRDNLLKKYISAKRMEITKIAHSKNKFKYDPIYIDVKDLSKYIKKTLAQYNFYRREFSKFPYYHEVSYESFFSNPTFEKYKLLSFLEQSNEDMPLQNIMSKISSTNIEQEIKNYKEVISFLKSEGYSHFLHDFY